MGYILYSEDGSFNAHGRFSEYDYEYKTQGSWKATNSEICNHREKSFSREISTKKVLHDGPDVESYCDKVIEYSPTKIIYIHNDGKTWKMVRENKNT